VLSESNIEILRSVYVDEGYEGAMVRWGNAPYKTNGRSDNLLKLKIMEDLALVIQDIVPNEADPTQGTPIVHLEDGTIVRCNVKGSHEERRHLLSHKQEYIGQKAEVRFFGYTDDGSLRHPTYYGIRHDK
jgi:ATP-dependent DNA ligase